MSDRSRFAETGVGLEIERVTKDEFNPAQERDETGKWTAGGGGGGPSKEDKDKAAIEKALQAMSSGTPVVGNSQERIALRKALKAAKSPGEKKAAQERILQSFKKEYDKAVKQGKDLKAAQLEGKMGKYASQYGLQKPETITTTAQANAGYSQQEINVAQEIIAATLTPAKMSTGQKYTPEETKAFNDLVKFAGPIAAKTLASNAAQSSFVKDGLLNAAEAAHVRAYTGSYYQNVNKILRGEAIMSAAVQDHVNQLNSALSKLPDYKGTVYRKVELNPSKAAKYIPGSIIEETQFTSSSKTQGVWSGSYRFEILSKTGKYIKPVSQHKSEDEVLFRTNTKFKVISRDGYLIKMQEL